MKYVRTMDDSFPIAYEVDKPNFDAPIMFPDGTIARLQDNDVMRLGHPRCLSFNMRKQHIIKEADTIEELCDAFVYVSKEDGNHMFHMNGKPRYSEFDDIYGAIWTNKGLIYVVKINEKGGWELL